jgi:hypothetical protein
MSSSDLFFNGNEALVEPWPGGGGGGGLAALHQVLGPDRHLEPAAINVM